MGISVSYNNPHCVFNLASMTTCVGFCFAVVTLLAGVNFPAQIPLLLIILISPSPSYPSLYSITPPSISFILILSMLLYDYSPPFSSFPLLSPPPFPYSLPSRYPFPAAVSPFLTIISRPSPSLLHYPPSLSAQISIHPPTHPPSSCPLQKYTLAS